MALGVRLIRQLTFPLHQRLIDQYMREAEEASMKDITTALLASLFVLITLVSLISADPIPIPHGTRWASLNSSGNVSELEFRYALRR